MTRWIALSGRNGARAGPAPSDPPGAIMLEFALPLAGPQVLLDARAEGLALSVFADPLAGVSVLIRRGTAATRHRIAGDLRLPGRGIARLVLGWPPGGCWTLTLDLAAQGRLRGARGRDGLRLSPGDLRALYAAAATVSQGAALLWHGATVQGGQNPPVAWIGPATPVATPAGPCPAALLQPGQPVMTPLGPRPLTAVTQIEVPTAGSLAPIRLRAPYLSRQDDVLVGPGMGVVLAGIAVEYLFGEDAVAVLARQLDDGRIAAADRRPGTLRAVSLEAGGLPILAGGCLLAPPGADGLRWLADWEALPLRRSFDGSIQGRAA